MRARKRRILNWLGLAIALLIAILITVVKMLPLLPDAKLADSDLIPIYQTVPKDKNPIPTLYRAFENAASGQGIDHSIEIGKLLSRSGVENFDTISALMNSDTRQAALSVAAGFPIPDWRYPEYKHHSQPVPELPDLLPTFRQKMQWVEWLTSNGMPEYAMREQLECLTIAGGLLGGDGGLLGLLIGISTHEAALPSDPEKQVIDQLLEHHSENATVLNALLDSQAQTDQILKTVAAQAMKREYLTHTKSLLEDTRKQLAGGRTRESFRINKTLNRVAEEQRFMIATMTEPLDHAPLPREDTNDQIDVDTWSMAKAYLRGNAYGQLIVAQSQLTIGALPISLAERRKTTRHLRCVSATALFSSNHEEAPASLNDLVEAGLLDAVPKDPFSGETLEFSFTAKSATPSK